MTKLEELLLAAIIGGSGWFIKNLLFGLMRRRNDLERSEWEYRLKEVFCPLYYWSGILVMDIEVKTRHYVLEQFHPIMARAAYVIPMKHYYTLVRIIEAAYDQHTSNLGVKDRDSTRAYLLDQIEVLNLLLYRLQDSGGAGDIGYALRPYRRLTRLVMNAAVHLLVWLLAALCVGGSIWVLHRGDYWAVGVLAIALLVVLWVDVRRKSHVERGIRARLRVQ